jgi:DNA invertase Pin-like site-specific DNA recombinase
MNKFVTYCRVSTKMQGRNGLGMESQTDTVRRFVEKAGGTIVSEYCEVENGGKTDRDRQELAKALFECRRVGATLVVAKLDRLSRNAEFLLSLQNGNVDFVCCDCPNVDRFTVGILALVAQRERELISERTKAALKMAKRRGVHLGTRDPAKQINLMVAGARQAKIDFKAKVHPLIEEIRKTGVSTLQGIADCLNRRGIPTRTGKSVWYPTTVKMVVG